MAKTLNIKVCLIWLLLLFWSSACLAGDLNAFSGEYLSLHLGYLAKLDNPELRFSSAPPNISLPDISILDTANTGVITTSLEFGFAYSFASLEAELQYSYNYSDISTGPELQFSVDLVSTFINTYVYYSPRNIKSKYRLPLGMYFGLGAGGVYASSTQVTYTAPPPTQTSYQYIRDGGCGVAAFKTRVGVTVDISDGAQATAGFAWLSAQNLEIIYYRPVRSVLSVNVSGATFELGGRVFI